MSAAVALFNSKDDQHPTHQPVTDQELESKSQSESWAEHMIPIRWAETRGMFRTSYCSFYPGSESVNTRFASATSGATAFGLLEFYVGEG